MLASRGAFKPWILLALLVALVPPGQSARASDPLRLALAPVAEDCARWLKGRRQVAVVVRVSGPATDTTVSSAPGVRVVLTEELRSRQIEVKDRADIAIRIGFQGVSVPDPRDRSRVRLQAELTIAFVDARENAIDGFPRRIDNEEAVRIILGLSNDRQGDHTAVGDKATVVSFFQPRAHLDGTAILAGDKSPFAVELLADGKAVQPRDRDGSAFAPIAREQEYSIRLINRSNQEMGVRLSIDGLNVFHFSELRQPATLPGGKPNPRKGEPQYDLILVPAKGEVIVPGWHRTNSKALAFKVLEYGQTAASQFGKDDAPVGTITATFAAVWEKDPPADEPPLARGVGDDGTGFGRPKEIDAKPVQRSIGAVRASVSVRYTVPNKP
jgi:hypothetical protein